MFSSDFDSASLASGLDSHWAGTIWTGLFIYMFLFFDEKLIGSF